MPTINEFFKRESEEFIQIILRLAHAQGYDSAQGESQICQIFEGSIVSEWNLGVEGVLPCHTAGIRKMLDLAAKGERPTIHHDNTEDGEVRAEDFCGSTATNESMKMLGEMLMSCSKKARKEEIHVETAKALEKTCGVWGSAAHHMLPSSMSTNLLAKEFKKLQDLGIRKPFVRMSPVKFLPEWCNDKVGDNYLLQPFLLMPALMRWGMAAQAVDMVSMPVAAAHADICMRVANDAKLKGKHATTAAVYDELLQKRLAETALKGVSDHDPTVSLTTFCRETFDQACDLADLRSRSDQSWKSKANWPSQGKWGQSKNDSEKWGQGCGKRGREQSGKQWDNKSWDHKKHKY